MAKKHKQNNYKLLLLYISFLAVFGPYGEILIGTLYTAAFGTHLWNYHVFPVHTAYTSLAAPFIWGLAGAITYFLHARFYARSTLTLWVLSAFVAVEMLITELIINFLYHIAKGGYIFYYYPGDLLHFASLQTLPFYYLVGIAVFVGMKRFQRDPIFFSILSIAFMIVLVYIAR